MPNHQHLVERLVAVLEPDERVRALFLTGSLGRGAGDEFSDVDTLLVVTPESYAAVLSDWAGLARRVGTVVHVQQLGSLPVFNHVLEGWLRWDASIVRPPDATDLVRSEVQPLFDKDGIALADPAPPGPPGTPGPPEPPRHDEVLALATEFIRCLGLLPVVVGRDDPVTAASGAGLLRQHVVRLLIMRADGGRGRGALNARSVLSADDYTALAALPALTASIEDAVRLHRACADLFLPVARELLGDDYPAEFELACLDHVATALAGRWSG